MFCILQYLPCVPWCASAGSKQHLARLYITPLEEENYAWQTYTFYTVYTGPLWDENCIRQIYTHALPVICEIETGLMNLYTPCWVFVEPNSTCKMYICISRHLWKGTLDESLQIVSCGIQTVSDKHMHMPCRAFAGQRTVLGEPTHTKPCFCRMQIPKKHSMAYRLHNPLFAPRNPQQGRCIGSSDAVCIPQKPSIILCRYANHSFFPQ